MEIEDLDIFEIIADQRGVVGALGAANVGCNFDLEGTAADIAELVEQVDDGTNLGDLRDSLINSAASGDASIWSEQAAAVVLSATTRDNGFSNAAVHAGDELQDGG